MSRPRNLIQLLDSLAPDVQKAFLESIANIRSDTQMAVMIGALERGDIDGALRAINLGAEYFAPLDRALSQAYADGGDWAIEGLKRLAASQGARITARFDGRNARAETFLRDESSQLITLITNDQRNAVRESLEENMRNGVSPRLAALDIVGRVNSATGRREGGLLGLTAAQASYGRNALAELRSGDPAQLRNYLGRASRDRRYDPIVNGAIRTGKAISAADIQRISGRYNDRLLRLRGDTIARTELLASLHAAQYEALQQLIDAGKVSESAIRLRWDSAEDPFTRQSHRAADDQEVRMGRPFTIGGFAMRYPGDTALGAPAKEVINCRCRLVQDINFLSALRPGD